MLGLVEIIGDLEGPWSDESVEASLDSPYAVVGMYLTAHDKRLQIVFRERQGRVVVTSACLTGVESRNRMVACSKEPSELITIDSCGGLSKRLPGTNDNKSAYKPVAQACGW